MGRPRTTNKHLPKYVTIIHGSYWYRAPGAKPVRVCRTGEEMALYRFIAENAAPIANIDVKTVADALDRYEREVLPSKAPRTQRDYIRHLRVLRKVFGHMAPNDVAPRDIGRFLDVSRGKIQRNRQIAVLSAVYSKMVGRWYCADKNPCQHVERNESKKRRRYVTDAEYAAVYALAPPRVQIMMELALRTYQRQGDLLSLKWSQVDDEGVTFQQGKTGKRLKVKRAGAVKLNAVLARAQKMLPHLPREYVVRNRHGKPYTGEGFRACWQRVMRKAVSTGAIKERFTFHDLRAKAISDTKDIQKAFEGAGHTSMAMTRGVYDRGIREVDPHE